MPTSSRYSAYETLPVEQRHPSGERRGFDGQQAHTAGV
jgi:hypothetical protein